VRSLRYAKLWWALGLLLVAIVLTLSLLPTVDVPVQGFNDKVNHTLAFAAMAGWFAGLYPRKRWWWVAGALLMLGGAIEILQWIMALGREAEWLDVAADATGIAIGLGVAGLGFDGWARWIEQLFVRAPQSS